MSTIDIQCRAMFHEIFFWYQTKRKYSLHDGFTHKGKKTIQVNLAQGEKTIAQKPYNWLSWWQQLLPSI